MRRLVVLMGLALLLTSCGQGMAPVVPVAARFEQLRLPLLSITIQSGRVAQDMSRLGSFMQAGEIERARGAAVELKRDALWLARRAGSVGNVVRGLAAAETEPQLRLYFHLTLQALSCQWYEGMTLARLADIAWADPYLSSGETERRFVQVQGQARWYAWRASVAAARAAGLRRRYPAAFRYVVVREDKAVIRL